MCKKQKQPQFDFTQFYKLMINTQLLAQGNNVKYFHLLEKRCILKDENP